MENIRHRAEPIQERDDASEATLVDGTFEAKVALVHFHDPCRDFAMSAASFSHPDHFQEAFNPQERQELLDEDTAAFSGVTGILIFVIGVGVALAAFSVAVIFAMS